jgi:hypothetical protein
MNKSQAEELEEVVKAITESMLDEQLLSDNYSGIAVDIYNSKYGIICHITILFKKPFSKDESDRLMSEKYPLIKSITKFFPDRLFSGGITSSHSTIEMYNRYREFYDSNKNFED